MEALAGPFSQDHFRILDFGLEPAYSDPPVGPPVDAADEQQMEPILKRWCEPRLEGQTPNPVSRTIFERDQFLLLPLPSLRGPRRLRLPLARGLLSPQVAGRRWRHRGTARAVHKRLLPRASEAVGGCGRAGPGNT